MMKCRKNTALHGIFLLQPDVLHFLQGLAQAALETIYHLKVSKRLVWTRCSTCELDPLNMIKSLLCLCTCHNWNHPKRNTVIYADLPMGCKGSIACSGHREKKWKNNEIYWLASSLLFWASESLNGQEYRMCTRCGKESRCTSASKRDASSTHFAMAATSDAASSMSFCFSSSTAWRQGRIVGRETIHLQTFSISSSCLSLSVQSCSKVQSSSTSDSIHHESYHG